MDIKELYYEADTRKHQQIVAERMIAVAKKIMDRAMIAAAKRRGNEPARALDFIIAKSPIDEQLQAIIRNTLAIIERA